MLLLLPTRMVAQTAASSSKYIATYESSTQTLTFKEYAGETLPKNSAWVEDKMTVAAINKKIGNGTIVHIVFDKSFSTYTPTSLYKFFANLTTLKTITGLEYLNTEKVTDMNRMFFNSFSLTSLDVTHFNTEKVTNMISMFSDCSSLTSLDVTHFNTAKVKYMYYMFSNCSSLTSLDVRNFNTANVTDMSSMFQNCCALTSLYLSNFNTENVTNMSSMFSSCQALTTICTSSKFVTTQVSKSSRMFYKCEKLKGEEVWTEDKATDKTYAKIEGGYFSGGIPRVKYADGTLTFFLTSKETLGENEYELNSGANLPGWLEHQKDITKVVFDTSFADARPTSCYYWFYKCEKLSQIKGIKNLNTEKVTNMKSMFYDCPYLFLLDVSGFNTDNVTNMQGMFGWCTALASLNVTNFNTENVTNMNAMFSTCRSLTSLDVTNFNTENVTNMSSMFESCSKLTSLDVTNFNTINVTNMGNMFCYCNKLTSLDVTNFNTVSVTNMQNMFGGSSALRTIYVSDDFVIDKITNKTYSLFSGCEKLKGAITEYNKNNTDYRFANYKTGYFTKLVGKNGDEKIGATGETLTADNLVLDDGKDFVAYEPFAAKAASYSRTINAGTTWATLCLPFEVSLANQNFRAFKLLSADDVAETVELEEVKTIEAGTPVIIKMKDGANSLSISEENKAIAKDVQTAETTGSNYQLQGLYTQKMFSKDTDNNCYIVKGDKLMNPAKLLGETSTAHVSSKPFRAYMVDNSSASAPAAGARMFSISVGGSTTAIEQLETTADSKAEYYDLQGRRLQDLQKGINIVKRGGKTMKVIIK